YDTPIIGYQSERVNTLRLWSAKSAKNLDMKLFGRGDYLKASAEKELAEVISKVLYPDDNHYEGKALRLKQHYFFVSASIQCIVANFKSQYSNFRLFPEKVAIHINDTHPALAIPELMRILLDEEGLDWDTAWNITVKTFAYTNHTIMSEALERWPENLFKEQLPRIHMIVHEINERYCRSLWEYFPGQWDKIAQMAIVAYGEVRMAPLCIVGSHSVNGVAPLHTSILKNEVFKDYNKLEPLKFVNITNGVTQRRWLLLSNPGLSELLNQTIGDSWIVQPWRLKDLEPYAQDASFRDAFAKVKKGNKKRLAEYIKENNQIDLDLDSIFDVHVKRLHEYKRQLLNVLHIMHLYTELLYNPNADIHPRTFIFGGKASPGYHRAKLIIKLINTVAERIKKDKKISEILKVVYIEDYRVTLAEKIIPAADVSEQISTAGKEASGTGNMKFMLNGALTIGTMDGANIEIFKAVGADNMYIFGLTADEVNSMHRYGTYDPQTLYRENHRIKLVLDQLVNGFLNPEDTGMFMDLYRSLLYGENGNMADPYMVLADMKSYSQTQEKIGKDFQNKDLWFEKTIINTANAGYFSSDRSIREYNSGIWKL
ncbi:MAG TPA: glycogen phosphorylase, partial [Clostridiales bacterium]|nr:glycogen phosphorylase [Clostridiales bacterium]